MRPDVNTRRSLGDYLRQRFTDEFEPPVDALVSRAFEGDTVAAAELADLTTCAQRARLAVGLWRGCPHDDVVALFAVMTWKRCPTALALALGDGDWRMTRHNMARLVREWELQPTEDELPQKVTVWRGTYTDFGGFDLEHSAGGFSWTLDRDAACWYALRQCEKHFDEVQNPAVLVATVDRADIDAFTRPDGEVILMTPPRAKLDGNLSDWKAAAVRHEARRAARMMSAAISQEKQR